MFDKVLIANRGEIALRVARACREMGIKSVALYSTADAESAVVRFADEAVHIGPPHPGKSYLNIPNVIGAAQKTGADAIHPGYGFLSENRAFAQAVLDAGLTWVGPPPDVIAEMGLKTRARELMQAAGVPIVPGTTQPVETVADALRIASEEVGFPVAVNPEARLAAIARRRGWHVEHWSKAQGGSHRTLPIGPFDVKSPRSSRSPDGA